MPPVSLYVFVGLFHAQNAFVARAPSRTRMGQLQTLPQPPRWCMKSCLLPKIPVIPALVLWPRISALPASVRPSKLQVLATPTVGDVCIFCILRSLLAYKAR